MFAPLLFAVSLSVPFLPQTEALCGGAAAAMVLRYWGETHASVDEFANLVDKRAGGIADDVLARAVADRGWSVTQITGSVDRLQSELEQRHPVIILISVGRARYHYVVVTGFDDRTGKPRVLVHDPTWGPARPLDVDELVPVWRASRFWSLLILPTEKTRQANATRAQEAPADEKPERGSLAEQAGLRFGDREWKAAADLASRAVQRNPSDRYAWDVLGSSQFMLDNQVEALRAWNHIDKPRIDRLLVDGIRRTRYRTISDALGLEPNTLLTVERFQLANRRLGELPDRAISRLSYSPDTDGFATVNVAMVERSWGPKGLAEWAAKGLKAGFDREVLAELPGPSGEGSLLTANWRFWHNRPGLDLSFAAPRFGPIGGVWRVDAGWDRQAYAIGPIEPTRFSQTRQHLGLTVSNWISPNVRYSASTGVDAWQDFERVRATYVGAAIERRWPNDRWALTGETTFWFARDANNFSRHAVRLGYRSKPVNEQWVYTANAGLEHATTSAPLSIWPGAGEGHVSDLLLRAHPLLDDGVIRLTRDTIFARTVAFSSVRADHWMSWSLPVRLAIGGFADVAGARAGVAPIDAFTDRTMGRLQVDIGAGIRLRIPGAVGMLRLDYGHGLRDGANAVTAGWDF